MLDKAHDIMILIFISLITTLAFGTLYHGCTLHHDENMARIQLESKKADCQEKECPYDAAP